MRLSLLAFITFANVIFAAGIPQEHSNNIDLFKELNVNSSQKDIIDIEQAAANGITDLFKKGKIAFSLVNVLKDALKTIGRINEIQENEVVKRDLVEDLLVKVFVALSLGL